MPEWKKISDIFDYEKGSLQSSKCTAGDYTFITAAEDWKTHNNYTHECEALIFAMAASGSLGRTHYFKGKFIASDLCFILQPKKNIKLDLSFYFYIFNFLRTDIVKKTATGTSKLAINQTNFSNYELPYFDYEHQILFKEKLKNIDNISLQFTSELSTQLSLLKNLRQSILQETVEGKLTAGWREKNPVKKDDPDTDAEALLEKIKEEKEKLIKKRKLKKAGSINNNISYRNQIIPKSWLFCKCDEIFFVTKLAGFEYTDYIKLKETGEIPVIRAQNVKPLKIDKTNVQYIDLKTSMQLERSALTKPCLLVTFIGAGIGDVSFFKENIRWHLAPNVAKMELFENCENLLNLKYLNYYLLSKVGQVELFKHVKATAQPCLSMGTIRDIDFIIPPLAEQRAIVEQVDSLLAIVDGLEKQVMERKKLSEELMQAVLREAFEG